MTKLSSTSFVLYLSCVFFVANAIVAQPAAGQQAATDSVHVIEDGQAQIIPAFRDNSSWVRENLWVETEFDSDGNGTLDRVHVDVTRPAQTQTQGLKLPVIYETSPYYSGTGTTGEQYFWDPKHELNAEPPKRGEFPPIPHQGEKTRISQSLIRTWVPRGFAVVHSCSPGTGRSQGCPTVGGKNESLAPKAVIDWLNGRAKGFTGPASQEAVVADWCNGNVGMTGTSYNGTLPLAAATTGVEGLKAIIPVAPNTSYYHYYRSHGLIRHPGGYMGEDIDVLYDFIHSGPNNMRDYCDCEVKEKTMQAKFDRINGDYNEFWEGRNYRVQLGNVKAAVLMAHAFNDWNVMPEHSVEVYEKLKSNGVPVQSYFHQGGHGGPPPMKQMNRWFTRYVLGVENGVENDPKAWIVREADRRNKPTAYADYPNPDAQMVTLVPGGNGLQLGTLAQSTTVAPGLQTLVDNVAIKGGDLAAAADSNHRLLFATPALQRPLHVSGTASLKIKLSSSKPAANLSVWVVSLPWKSKATRITDNVITRGWADPQNHESMTESKPLEPGTFYELDFTLQPDDQIIPAGQQIGLMIFSSDREYTLWPEAGTELTVDISATSLTLPIVGGASAMSAATGN